MWLICVRRDIVKLWEWMGWRKIRDLITKHRNMSTAINLRLLLTCLLPFCSFFLSLYMYNKRKSKWQWQRINESNQNVFNIETWFLLMLHSHIAAAFFPSSFAFTVLTCYFFLSLSLSLLFLCCQQLVITLFFR